MAPSRANYHHGDLAAALLDAAETILVRDGAADLRLRQVALEVGVAPSAAYHHFADRAALIDALGVRALDALTFAVARRLARPAIRKASVTTRLQALGHAYILWARREPERFAIAFGPERAAEGVTQNRRPYELLEALLDEAVADGTLSGAARGPAERAVWPAIHGVAVLAAAGPLKRGKRSSAPRAHRRDDRRRPGRVQRLLRLAQVSPDASDETQWLHIPKLVVLIPTPQVVQPLMSASRKQRLSWPTSPLSEIFLRSPSAHPELVLSSCPLPSSRSRFCQAAFIRPRRAARP